MDHHAAPYPSRSAPTPETEVTDAERLAKEATDCLAAFETRLMKMRQQRDYLNDSIRELEKRAADSARILNKYMIVNNDIPRTGR